jgi:hypothetical protein
MAESLERASGGRALGKITVSPDPFVEKIVAGWPVGLDATRARALGLTEAGSLETVIGEYIADYLK